MSNAEHTAGVVPATNDIAAGLILAVVYFIRVASVTTPKAPLPWYLMATTDTIIPTLAAVWWFCAPIYTLSKRHA